MCNPCIEFLRPPLRRRTNECVGAPSKEGFSWFQGFCQLQLFDKLFDFRSEFLMVPFTFPDCDEIVPSVFDGSVALQCFFVDLSHAHVIMFRMFGVSFWEASWATMIETSIELVDRLSLKVEPVNVDLTLSHLNATFSGVVSMSDAITTTLIQLMFHPMQPFGGSM